MADYDLTTAQLNDIRDNFIRDRWTDYVAGPPAVNAAGLSEFNKSRKANFFSDNQLQAINAAIVNDWLGVLEVVWLEKYEERIADEDDDASAMTAADTLVFQARARLIRVQCRKQMMDDPGYRASLTVGDRSNAEAIEKQWDASNREDLAWVRSHSGRFNTVEVERG